MGVSLVRSLWCPEEPTPPPFCFVILAMPNVMVCEGRCDETRPVPTGREARRGPEFESSKVEVPG